MTPVQNLHDILNRARISDDEIRGGIRLTDQGYEKLAARLGTSTDEIKTLINTLVGDLNDEHNEEVSMTEGTRAPRYAYESDFMGNLTIRDSKEATEHYVSGSESAHLIKSLRATRPDSREEQLILQRACEEDQQGLTEDAETTDDGFVSELKNDAGSYNFPWRSGNQHGTATAAYVANEKKFEIEVVSVRDARGDEVDTDPRMNQDITDQARAFIGKE